MPIHPEELSVFFNRLSDELVKEWDNRVDDGAMSDWSLTYKRVRLEEIGSILTSLADGKAVLTYPAKSAREPAPLIRLPWDNGDA